MKKTLTLFLIFCVFVAVSCNREQNHTKSLPSNWSTYRPETIPFRVRQQNYERGNLIPNSSFESGRLYEIENEQEPFNAPGWTRSGEHVYWVNSSVPQFDTSEVSTGKHAIKIVKQKSDETKDVGEGVMSDFIKVIPGKYLLSIDVRLKDIKSSKSRLGTKLYDAIDIRIIYYDKNKIEISPNQYSEYYQTNINTSYKWLSFAHFNKIDSLDWTTVFCESAYPPFPDGYVPDEARFIKVFVGLKGAGTMWVDNINYYYSKENFSLQERFEPLFLNEYDRYDLVLPTPKKLIKKNQIKLISDSSDKEVLVIYPQNSKINNSLEFSGLMDKLSKYKFKIGRSLSLREISQYNIIFSLGKTDVFNKTIRDSIINQVKENANQGYIIRTVENFPNIVFISSNSELGLKYGVGTAAQLIDTSKNIFYNAEITDWPDIGERSVTVNSKVTDSGFEELIAGLRFNTVFSKNLEVKAKNKEKHGFIADEAFFKYAELGINQRGRPLLLKTTTMLEEASLPLEKTIWYNPEFARLEMLNQLDKENRTVINSLGQLDFKGVIWKGTSNYSPYIDNLDYNRFREYIDNPVILSLSMDYYPYEIPVNANNLLSLPDIKISGTIFEKINHLNFEIDSISLVNKLKLISMSCYSWSKDSYNPDEVLYKVLLKNIEHEGDIFKLISLSDKFKILQWHNHENNKPKGMVEQIEFNELITNYRFEDKNLDSVLHGNIEVIEGKQQSY